MLASQISYYKDNSFSYEEKFQVSSYLIFMPGDSRNKRKILIY